MKFQNLKDQDQRDGLLLSIPMGWTIITLGYIGAFLQPLMAGFSLMLVYVSYLLKDGKEFLGYYSEIAPTISKIFIFGCYFSIVVNSTYSLFSFIVIQYYVINSLYTATALIGIICLYLSLDIYPFEQILCSMNRREPLWWESITQDSIYTDWLNNYFNPYMTESLIRSLLFIFMALLFVFTFQHSSNGFIKGFSL